MDVRRNRPEMKFRALLIGIVVGAVMVGTLAGAQSKQNEAAPQSQQTAPALSDTEAWIVNTLEHGNGGLGLNEVDGNFGTTPDYRYVSTVAFH